MLVKDLLTDIARFFGINGEINTKKLRSFAHVAEFALLGACLAAISLFVAYEKGRLMLRAGVPFVCTAFAGGVLVAIVDEILQLFSDGRACEIKDVCLDSSGVILGIAVSCVIAFINYKIHKAREIKKGKTL
jgi:VanZ family protein